MLMSDVIFVVSGEDPDEIHVIPEGKDQIHLVFKSTVSQTKPTVRIGREISVIDTPETHLSEFG